MADVIPHMITLRLNADDQPDPSGLTYWQVDETHTYRRWFTILHDGWVIAEAWEGPDGWRVGRTPLEPIPPVVLARTPLPVAQLLGACPTLSAAPV